MNPKRPDASSDDSFEQAASDVADRSSVDWRNLEESGVVGRDELEALRKIAKLHEQQRDLAERESKVDSSAGLRAPKRATLEEGFELFEELGRGAFGRVHRARDRKLDRIVALKVLDRDHPATSEERRRFVQEARLLAKVEHANVIRIWSIDEDAQRGELRLALEYVEGQTLKALVEKNGPLDASEAARVGRDLCRALAAIHARGLVHRDVKPANAMRARNGRIVMLDFGLAHVADAASSRGEHGTPGTPFMMAPEMWERGRDVGPTADLYALGVTLYWLVCGKYPWDTSDLGELLARKQAGKAVPLVDRVADVPAEFAELVTRAIDPDPKRRFTSAGEFELELRRFLSHSDGGVGQAPAAPRRLSRPKVVLLGAAVVLLAFGVRYGVAKLFSIARNALTTRDTVAASAPLELATRFFVTRHGRDETPLYDGDTVKVGDRVRVEVRANHDAWVYVFDEDLGGALFSEFPLADVGAKNPVAAGDWRKLPGVDADGRALSWEITSGGGGAEQFVLIASAERHEGAEELVRQASKPALRTEVSSASSAQFQSRSQPELVLAATRGGNGLRGAGVVSAETPNSAGAHASVADFKGLAPLVRELANDPNRDRTMAFSVVKLVNGGKE